MARGRDPGEGAEREWRAELGGSGPMMVSELSALRTLMHREHILYCFGGYLNEEVLASIGQVMRRKLEGERASRSTTKALFSVYVELAQNVIRYSAEHESSSPVSDRADMRYGLIAVGRDGNDYFISCGNLVLLQDAERLNQDLSHIQGLDKASLKDLYKKTLRASQPESSKGAGVGLIDIARRATRGFDFGFSPSEGDRVFFALKAYL